ncbi:MAG: hypothetical protein AB7U95_37820 [Reyranella sp.]
MTPHDPHRPPHAAQLEHAQHHARSALSALHAIDAGRIAPGQYERLSRLAAALADVADELAQAQL